MTPHDFIEKWSQADLTERAASQSHFNDLCALLGEKTPADADHIGEWYAFEKGAIIATGVRGWADVWKRGHFAWEYKRDNSSLETAFAQLLRYSSPLECPPLLIVADTKRFRIHTNWTNTVQKVTEIALEELIDAQKRQILKWAFTDPEKLKPGETRQQLTEQAAAAFVQIAKRLRERGHAAEDVAHFVNRMVFCMFAEDVNLLPGNLFTKMLEASLSDPGSFQENARQLFEAMRAKGGRVGFERVEWFNGGLFDDDRALPLDKQDVREALAAARLDWSNIDPSIMGTLFERGLDPDKRSQLGAHYTDAEKIMLIVNPVIVEPLTREWEDILPRINAALAAADDARAEAARTRSPQKSGSFTKKANAAQAEAEQLRTHYLERLKNFRVLDPACGSGNFLYMALRALKDLEHRANLDAEALGLPREFPRVGPECVKGIEINPFAAELARVSVWIGEIQWMQQHGFDATRDPILKPLETIECRDALLNPDGTEAEWPETDVIIGNPPFLGDRKMKPELGEGYVDHLRKVFRDRVRGGADLVCFWFAISWNRIARGRAARAGLVATNSIRGGANREVLKPIVNAGRIFSAWDDEDWTIEGAAVRVSLICFDAQSTLLAHLDGQAVTKIYSDLTASVRELDTTGATRLIENSACAFQGTISYGPFQIPGDQARQMLRLPANPNGCRNSDVVRPWTNGREITRRHEDRWIIFFPAECSETEAALYDAPFGQVTQTVKSYRARRKNEILNTFWWRLWRSRPEMFQELAGKQRQIVTPRVAKYRLFVWRDRTVVVDSAAVAIARDDDTTFGILHSRFHELWSLRMGTSLEDRPRYTPTTCFETFPFPDGLTADIPAADYADDPRAIAIAAAAKQLDEYREAWLNPPDWTERVPEVVPGYSDRILPRDGLGTDELQQLKKRTLTNLYNERPAWLDNAHRALDDAVADAYGWPRDLSDDEILERLFHLNQERAAAQPS